ncbi:tetratricopeptide repeat protein [Flavobacterium sp. TBRC 19031]|uniref:tetratricopeptide repeat protein n=1 Tax=Flavobacterium mekongense TaxID=3379707 RepID=UPI00399BE46A
MRKSIVAICFLFANFVFAQNNEGYWDNIRTTNETIILEAGKRKAVKSSDLPVGTTEVVFRISLLDDNQKISASLVSLLKAIPDPSGISQGTAGAVFLLSTITGDDKCKFYVFTNESDALNYEKSGIVKNTCMSQEEPVNKAAKLLTEDSKCMSANPKNLWFGFQSENWVMKQKIVLEVVPWVNNSLRSGWSVEAKKSLLKTIEKSDVTLKVANKDMFLGAFLTALTKKYTYTDYQKLLTVEKTNVTEMLIEESLVASGQLNSYLESLRKEAQQLRFSNKTQDAILSVQKEIIDKKRAKAADYGLLGSLYLSSKQFVKAEEAYLKAVSLDKTDLYFQLQLAHVYLFADQLGKAKDLHKKYQNNHLSDGKSWAEQTKADFQQFEKNGFDTVNFKKILRLFN